MKDFQNIGIFLQLTAMTILLLKIACTLDCTGISGRTQILFALVFTTRFLDFPYDFQISLPSFMIKITYLSIAYLMIIFVFVICRRTYEREHDTFRFEMLIGLCTVLSLLSTYDNWELFIILWYLSIFLEAFAMLPQVYFTWRSRYAGSSLLFYIGLLTCYRAFFIVHWTYLYLTKGYIENLYVVICGLVQFIIYFIYFFWMLPIFKSQYAHHKLINNQRDLIAIIHSNTHEDKNGTLTNS